MTSSPRFRCVFVLGVTHCGSTLLGRLLNRHPRVLCVGEMMRIKQALAIRRPCSCGEQLMDCTFWKPLLPVLASRRYNHRLFTPGMYDRISKLSGREVVLDLSKSLAWRRIRRWWWWWWQRADVGTIFLVRDSRGSLGALKRRGSDLQDQLRLHRKWMRRFSQFERSQGNRVLRIYYEDLALNPEHELRRVTHFLNLEFIPELLRPAGKVHHFIHSSYSDYLKGSNEIRLDERWRQELTPEEIDRITKVMASFPVLRDRYLAQKRSERTD